jgi:uncharacterized Ntn-hydrolase superfamily protein
MNISTFTLIARDPKSGEIAVAGGTNWFCYGRWVPHIEAGVGAVATQAETNMNYSRLCLQSLRSGLNAQKSIDNALAEDPDNDGVYQLLVMDKDGSTACHTGDSNHIFAGFISEQDFIVAGNTLVDNRTIQAVYDYYMSSNEEFGLKVINSLIAGHKVGGDIRGMKSAAMKIANNVGTGDYWNDVKYDLRVDENSDPFKELRRIYTVACAYGFIGDAEEALNDDDALESYKKGLLLDPQNTEIKFWMARIYARQNKLELSNALIEEITKVNPLWKEYWTRLDARDK